MADAPLLVERRETLALVTLKRPEKHNALSADLLGRLQTAVRELGEDAAVRVVVLRGNDRCFSTGMDLAELAGVTAVADTRRALGVFHGANAAIERCPKPVIAAIAGWCLTGAPSRSNGARRRTPCAGWGGPRTWRPPCCSSAPRGPATSPARC